MFSEFIRRCIISPEIEEEVRKTAQETRKMAEAVHRTAKTAEETARKMGPDLRTGLVAAGLGLMLSGAIAGWAISTKREPKK